MTVSVANPRLASRSPEEPCTITPVRTWAWASVAPEGTSAAFGACSVARVPEGTVTKSQAEFASLAPKHPIDNSTHDIRTHHAVRREPSTVRSPKGPKR